MCRGGVSNPQPPDPRYGHSTDCATEAGFFFFLYIYTLGYHDLPKRTGTDRNGAKKIPKRTSMGTETDRNGLQLTRKRIKKIHASYTLEGTNLENVESIKYLGVI